MAKRATRIFPEPTTSRRRAIAASAGCSPSCSRSSALWPLFFGGALRWWSLITAGGYSCWSRSLAPALLALPNRLWLRFGLLLNRIVSPVVLAFLFYVVVTPMGALMRVFGKDNLRCGAEVRTASYWIRRDPPGPKPDSLNHQF